MSASQSAGYQALTAFHYALADEAEEPHERSSAEAGCCSAASKRFGAIIGDLVDAGVVMQDPGNSYIGADARIEPGAWIGAGTHVSGHAFIGAHARVGPNAIIDNSVVGRDAVVGPFSSVTNGSELKPGALVKARSDVYAATIGSNSEVGPNAIVESSQVKAHAKVGPFCRVRANSIIGVDAYIGTQAEVKCSEVGDGSKVGHFSFVGDAVLGRNVNIGAGAVTANYDGERVQRTIIDDEASIGAGTVLIAPIHLGVGARTGAGAVVTRDVPPGDLVAGVPARLMARGAGNNVTTHDARRGL